MKKIQGSIKPFISIIFGAIVLVYYLNWLSYSSWPLALGIIAMVVSAYFIATGIVSVILGNKLSDGLKKIFDVVSIALFASFMFTYFLMRLIALSNASSVGPNGWIITILSLIAAIALVVIYLLASFIDNEALKRFAKLFAFIFLLALVFDLLFDGFGDPIVLGSLDVVKVVMYVLFADILLAGTSSEAKESE